MHCIREFPCLLIVVQEVLKGHERASVLTPKKKEKQYVCLVLHAEIGAACADLSASVDVS